MWQPLSTAPRDGTPIELWNKEGFQEEGVRWENGAQPPLNPWHLPHWSSGRSNLAYSHWSYRADVRP